MTETAVYTNYLTMLAGDSDTLKTVAKLSTVLSTMINNYSDNLIQENITTLNEAGYSTVLERSGGSKSCKFCQALAGRYTDGDYDTSTGYNAFTRHEGCKCTLLYTSPTTSRKLVTNYNQRSQKERDLTYINARKRLDNLEHTTLTRFRNFCMQVSPDALRGIDAPKTLIAQVEEMQSKGFIKYKGITLYNTDIFTDKDDIKLSTEVYSWFENRI